jgi:hypothetical protein
MKGKSIHIFGTHTQADDDQRPTREAQLRVIRSLINRMAIPADQPVFIAGDLNVDLYTEDQYTTMLSILLATHPVPQSGERGFTSHPANDYVDDNSRAKYLDYFLYSNNHLKPDSAYNDVRIPKVFGRDLSDHYPVEGNFSFSDVGSEPLGTFPFVVFFEGNNAERDYVCNVSMESEKTLNFKKHRECVNDEVRSLILYDMPARRTLRLFDSPDGSRRDDWVEIVAKRKVSKKQINTFERSFEDADVRVTYHRDNGLDGKVSRLEVECVGDCGPPDANRPPTITAPHSIAAQAFDRITFQVRVGDADGDRVQILTAGLPPTATFSPTSGTGVVIATFTWVPTPEDASGINAITFTARDEHGKQSSHTTVIRFCEDELRCDLP